MRASRLCSPALLLLARAGQYLAALASWTISRVLAHVRLGVVMAKSVAFGADDLSLETVAAVKRFASSAVNGNRSWVELGKAACERPKGVTLAAFAAAVVASCERQGLVVPAGLSAGSLSKGEKVARVLDPLGLLALGDDNVVWGLSQANLYKLAVAVEDGVCKPSISDAYAWLMSDGKLDRKRKEKSGGEGEGEGEGEGAERVPDAGSHGLSAEDDEALRIMREAARVTGESLVDFVKRAVAAAIAN